MNKSPIALALALALPLSGLPMLGVSSVHAASAKSATSFAGFNLSFQNSESEAFKFSRNALDLAIKLAMDDPEKGLEGLINALEDFKKFAPEIAADSNHQELQRKGMLTLAQGQIYLKSQTAATETMRTLYLTDPPPKSELKAFGPSLRKLATNQRKQIDKLSKSRIEVKCSRPCRIFVNERRISENKKYPIGEYRIYVEDNDGKNKPMAKVIELRNGQERWTENYYNEFKEPLKPERPEPKPLPGPSSFGDGEPGYVPPPDEPTSPGFRRIAPLWLEITGTVIGAGTIGGGAYALYKDGACGQWYVDEDGERESCAKFYKNKVLGISLVAGGGVLFATSLTLWIIDTARKRKAESSGLAQDFLRSGGKIRF